MSLWTWRPTAHRQAWLWVAVPVGFLAGLIGDEFGRSAVDAVIEGVAVGGLVGVLCSVLVQRDRNR